MDSADSRIIRDNVTLKQERLEHSERNTALALAIFAAPLIAYCATFVAILWLGFPWGLPLVAVSTWLTGALFIIGHDACHQAYTSSRPLNAVIGRIAMLPSLHSYSLWDLYHNRIHHKHNNVRAFDFVWEPMSPDEYAAAPALKRIVYRLLRSPIGVFVYYGTSLWLPKIFLLGYKRHGEFHRVFVLDALLVWGFLILQVAVAIWLGGWYGHGALESVLLAVVLPFLGWNAGVSFVVYLHHTHPDVPWYRSVEEWRAKEGSVFGTAYVRFPWLTRKLMLEIMEHNAHHYAPGVPLYNLESMQTEVRRQGQGQIVQWRFSLPRFLDVTRRCKLFDYEQGRWVTF